MIPKNIFQAWIGEIEPPEKIKFYMKTLRDAHPDWNCILLGNKDMEDLYKKLPDNAKEIYDYHLSRKEWGLVLDPIRFLVPYLHGGIFMDTDVKVNPRRSYNELPLEKNLILCNSFEGAFRPHSFFIGCSKENRFIKYLLDNMKKQIYSIERRDVYNCSYILNEYYLRFEPEKRERMVSSLWSIPFECLTVPEDEVILHPDSILTGRVSRGGISTHWPMSSHTINKHKYIKTTT